MTDTTTDISKKQAQNSKAAVVYIHTINANMSALQKVSLTWNDAYKKPDWFEPLVTKIDNAKVAGSAWTGDIMKDVIETVPAQIVGFVGEFEAAVKQVTQIALANPDAKGADDPHVKEVIGILKAVKSTIKPMVEKVDATSDNLVTFQKAMNGAYSDLNSGVDSIQEAEHDLKNDIDGMNTQISNLESEIDKYMKGVVAGGITDGLSLLVIVGGIALAPETGGLSLIASGVGLVGLVAGTATLVAMEVLIHKDRDKIEDKLKTIQQDHAEIAALKILGTSVSTGLKAVQNTLAVLTDFRAGWDMLDAELETALAGIETAIDDAPLQGLLNSEIVSHGALAEWKAAAKYAQILQTADVTIENKDLSKDPTNQVAA